MRGDDRRILHDPDAESADPSLPGYLAPPPGAPEYHGFLILDDSLTDGWRLGAITAFETPDGCDGGDAFVIAPDGSRAGLMWEIGSGALAQVVAPSTTRWGVYRIGFPGLIRTRADLIAAFRRALPELQALFARVRGSAR